MIRLDNKFLIVQHNNLIEARYRLSTNEQKIIKILISLIRKDDEEFKEYTLSVLDIAKILNIKRKDIYKELDLMAERLLVRILRFRNENGEYVKTTWLSSSKYKDGIIKLSFDPSLKPLLLQLKKHFTQYELGNIINLRSSYAIRIYELCKQYCNTRQKGRVFYIDELKEILGIEKEKYKIFRDLKNRVLLPSQKELKEKTDLFFTWEEIRQGRKCVAVRIAIEKEEKERINNALPIIEDGGVYKEEVLNDLKTCNINDKKAHEILALYKIEYIQEKIEITKKNVKEGKCKNVAGFILKALQEDWKDEIIKKK